VRLIFVTKLIKQEEKTQKEKKVGPREESLRASLLNNPRRPTGGEE
jgi:hypothetical protein